VKSRDTVIFDFKIPRIKSENEIFTLEGCTKLDIRKGQRRKEEKTADLSLGNVISKFDEEKDCDIQSTYLIFMKMERLIHY
jgi:hypothetical protein